MKSHVRDLLDVLEAIYYDACQQCTADPSPRDLNYIRSRIEQEGFSFLTITLPNFASDLEMSLELGYIDPKLFRCYRKNRSIPAFLQGMIGQLFDRETGRIINDVPHYTFSAVVRSARQICLAFKKIRYECSPERVDNAIESFVNTEHELSEIHVAESDRDAFASVVAVLWDNNVGDLRPHMFVPRHGPGATADGRRGNRKFQWRSWHERLEPYFPFIDSCYPISIGELDFESMELESVTFYAPEDERPVKVITVPKTLKSPRIIAIEPCCMQYAQQGIRRPLMRLIESHWQTKGQINFTDQSINQSFALSASKDGQYATIDLSDASDRVPRDLAMEMFRANPDLQGAIDACRSTHARLPDGRVIGPLNKFASMGSALCFPVEAMYFYTVCVVALLRAQNLSVTFSNAKSVGKEILVYGDDIIVPTKYAVSVLDHLQKYLCKVNSRKTFYRGIFRESCGTDAVLGFDVTPQYLGRALPKNRQQAQELISWVETANHFYNRGYRRTSDLIFCRIESILGKLPHVSSDSSALGRTHFGSNSDYKRKRFNRRYQRNEILCWVPSEVHRTDALGGYAALMKSLQKLEDLKDLHESRDELHLERSARYGVVALKRRWVDDTLVVQ